MWWGNPPLFHMFILISSLKVIQASSQCPNQVPSWLQCTHLNVAAEKNGATCISSSSEAGRECNKTIDGRTEAGSKNSTFAFNSTQSANHSIKIMFTRHFLVNKLRVMQLDSDSTQISSVRLEFSDFSSEEIRLTPKTGDAVMEEISFTPRIVSWIQLVLNQTAGFREIEVYYDLCMRERQCDIISLLPSNDSGPIALVDNTVMFSVNQALQGPLEVRLTTTLTSNDGYIFKIGASNVSLFRVLSTSETPLKVENSTNILDVGWRTLWVDYRCTSVILGSGSNVILNYTDTDNHQNIYFIKFEKPLNNQTILLCNRQDQCNQNATYYWPLDKAIGDVLLDVRGKSNGKGSGNLTENDVWVSGPTWHSVRSSALDVFESGPVTLVEDFSTSCLGDILLCKDGLTVAFWFKLTDDIADSQRLLYSAKVQTDISITAQSNQISAFFFTSSLYLSVSFNVTLHQWHHVTFTWAYSIGLFAVLDFVHSLQGGPDNSVTLVTEDVPLTIGQGPTNAAAYLSHVVVYEMFLNPSQIQRIGKCTDLVSDTAPESFGVVTGIIPDDAFAATSSLVNQSAPQGGRALVKGVGSTLAGAWIPSVRSTSEYLQIDLLEIRNISAVMIQGRDEAECSCSQWVTEYTLSYSLCGSFWSDYSTNGSVKHFTGNHDGETMVSNSLCPDLTARVLRFHPTEWNTAIAMRIDVLASRNAVNYLGCFSSPSDMVLFNDFIATELTPESCVTVCGKASMKYAGITSSFQCYCSNTSLDVSKKAGDAACYYPCAGDKGLKCGSHLYFSVYEAPGEFNFPFTMSVINTSEAFTAVQIVTAPTYNGAEVIFNFGDGTVIKTKNSTYNYTFTSLGTHEVYSQTTVGYFGRCQTISDMKSIDTYIPISGMRFKCPSFVEAWTSFECSLKVTTGSNMDIRFVTPLGEIINGTMEDSTPLMAGFRTPLSSSEAKMNLTDTNKTIILPNYYFGNYGQLMALKSNTTHAGYIKFQILRPVCLLSWKTSYCFVNGSCETDLAQCSLVNLGYSCPSTTDVFCGQSVDCKLGLLACPGGATFNSTLATKYEVVHSSLFFLPKGFHITVIDQPGFKLKTSDIVAIGTVENIGAQLISTDTEGNAFVFNSGHLDVGEILPGDGNAALEEIRYRFDLVVVFVPPVYMVVGLRNFPVGNWNQTGTVGTEVTDFDITVSVSIKNITWIVPDFVATNQSFNITVLAHPGHNVTYGIRIGDEYASYAKYNKSETEFFYTWTNVSNNTLPMLFNKEGEVTMLLTASNLLSSSMRKCQVGIMDQIKDIYLFNITPVALGNDTEISWVVERGTNVTYNISFGDGNFIDGLFKNLAIFVGCYTYRYAEEGNFTVTVTAYNLVSIKTVTGVAEVVAPIAHLSCRVIHQARDIEVNETIQLNATFPQGTNAKALVDFADGSSTFGTPIQSLFCTKCSVMYSLVVSHSYSTYGVYAANMKFYNTVSKKNCTPSIVVHKPVYPLTGFNIACAAANLSTPTACMLSITGGNDFWCDWDFGADGQTNRGHYWNLTLPVENIYNAVGNFTVFTNCSNRLYNTSVIGEAIVQEPITGFLVTCPANQSVDEDFNLHIAVTTGTSMHFEITLQNVFANVSTVQLRIDTDLKSNTFPISRLNFSAVGVYRLTVKAVNLVTPLQIFTREIKVDKVVTNLRLFNADTFIGVNQTTESRISIDTGTNVTVEWDFNDGQNLTSLFSGDSLRISGDNQTHSYTDHGVYLLNVTASNPVSTLSVTKYLYVQYIVKDIEITSNSPQEIPPGSVTFTVSVKSGTHPPTNATIDIDFGNGRTKTNIPLGGVQAINISSTSPYTTPGIIKVDMTMKNNINSVNLTDWVDVQQSIKDLRILSYHTGGYAGYGAPGRGPNNTDFPLEYKVLFMANISDGTAVTYTWNFGDGTQSNDTENTTVLHRFSTPQPFNITLWARNSVSSMTASRVIRMMLSILNVTFTNDGPTVIEYNTTLFITIGERGTDSCFLVDLGNDTRILYKGFDNVSCDNEFNATNDITVLPSLNFSITFEYWNIWNYAVKLIALNSVSRITKSDLVVILRLPCSYPILRIPDAGQTFNTRAKYFRADYISIKSRCTIDCLASRETAFQWELTKLSTEADSGSILQTVHFDKTLSVLIIPQRTLPYGRFRVGLNVSMVGLPRVYNYMEAYVEIRRSPLVAAIIGGNYWTQSVHKKVILDASPSYDPDYGLENKQGLEYFWYCKTADEDYDFPSAPENNSNSTNATGGCFKNGTRRLLVNTEVVEFEPNSLLVNTTYIFKFFIRKDLRKESFLVRVSLTHEDVPTMIIKRPYEQHPGKENPFAKLSLTGVCRGCNQEVINTLNISWSLWIVIGGVKNYTAENVVKNETFDDESWLEVTDLSSMTRAGNDSEYLILKANSLQNGTSYAARVKGSFGNGATGTAQYIFNTALPPTGKQCYVIKGKGNGHEVFNTLVCEGWKTRSGADLIYDYFYSTSPNGTEYLIQFTRHWKIENIRLPPGLEEYNYTLYMKAVISDKMATRAEFRFEHQSLPSQENDSHIIEKLLEAMAINGTLRTLEMEGYSQFTNQYILSVSLLLNAMSKRAANITGFKDASKKIRTNMSYTLAKMKMDDIKTVRETANSVIKLAAIPDECEVETQLQLNETLSNMVALIMQLSPISDSMDLWGTLNTVSEALGNTLGVVSHLIGDENLGNGTNSTIRSDNYTATGKVLIENINEYVKMLSDAYLNHTLPKEEPIQVRSPSLYFTLNKDYPAGLAGRQLHCGVGGAIIPDNFGDLTMVKQGNKTALTVLDTLVTSTPFLPFVWSLSAKQINSHFLSLEIRNTTTQEQLEIANLTEPVVLWIIKGDDALKPSTGEVEYTKTLKHSFDVKHNHSSINIEIDVLGVIKEQPSLVVYLRKGEQPTMDGDKKDKVRVIPQLHHANNESGRRNASNEEFRDPKVAFFSNEEFNGTAAGKYFVIIKYNGTISGAEVPKENRTVKYSFSVYTSECLYWDELNETWIGEGCVVGPLSNSTHTQCLCTHLSSFASSFFVPPNTIDWGKVNLAEFLNNPTVTIIVCCIFLLYFLLLIWARRKDKKDLQLAGVTPLPSNDPRDLFSYEITVFTGYDSCAGTTADVSIVLTGTLEQTQSRLLRDVEPTRRKFQKGSIDYFLLTVPRPLGKIEKVRIWHNNAGTEPSWFLARVLVRDLQTGKTVWFVCDRWLAVEEDDGQIDRTLQPASKEDLVRFNFLFSTEVRKNLSDGHLWYSVLCRPLRSSFTRIQRLSCCLSILTCTMLANAMFYRDGEGGEDGSRVEVKIGPIRLSTKQIGIGVMSSLVVLPVNLVVINIFRKARPKVSEIPPSYPQPTAYEHQQFEDGGDENEDVADEEIEEKEKDKKTDKKGQEKKKPFTLPHFTIYIAYVLIVVASTTSAVFTIFYSLTFGEAKSQRWISSMMISFSQDVIISQPLKVIVIAVLFALIIKDPDKALEEEGKQTPELGKDEELIHDPYGEHLNGFDFKKSSDIPKPPSEQQLYLARQRRQKQKQMKAILRETFLYFAFILVMCVVAYGSRDYQAYAVTRTLTDIFAESKYTALLPFDTSSESSKLWQWIDDTFVPSLQPRYWYGPFIEKHEEELWSEESVARKSRSGGGRKIAARKKGGGSYVNDYAESFESLTRFASGVTADRGMFYIVGVARLRQLRVTRDSCTVPKYLLDMIPTCTSYYSWEDEDEGAFRPGWEQMEDSDIEKLPDDHQSPWIWQSALRLNGTPFWGLFASYWGGGFVYNLESTRLTSLKKIQDLQIDGWIDRYTRAVFAEFTVYNAHTNFFGVVTMLTEILPTGGYYHYPKVSTIRLYRYTGPEQVVVMAFEFIFFAFLCVYVYCEAKQLFVLGKKYFADPWNYIELLVICSSFSAIFLYLAELGFTKVAIKRMRANPEAFISFDYIIFLDEAYMGTLGFAVFCAFLKVLKLLRFNRRISMLVQTIKVSSGPLISFFFMFLLFFLAFTQVAFLVFGPVNEDYASFVVAAETMLSMTLGGFDFIGLQNANRLIGPIFFISYMVFIFLILVNVFLSIVNDAFAEVSSDVAKQTNEHEVLDYIWYCVKEQVGGYVSSPFKPLYKPSLTDFERAVADIEDRAENIVFFVDNINLEEQRQANWLKIEKMNEKKATVIRFVLHSGEDFDEDDFASAIPLMAKFLSEHTQEELQHISQKKRNSMSSSFSDNSTSLSLNESSVEELYEYIDSDDSSLNSWFDFEQPTYSDLDMPTKFRSLHSIVEENEPSEFGESVQQGCNETSFHCSGNEAAVSISKASSLNDVYVEIPDEAERGDTSSQLATHN